MTPSNNASSPSPSKPVGLLDASSIMIGVIIGVGIFESAPLIASSVPNGTALLAIWGIGALLSLVGGMCFAELATTYPKEGGPYQYLNRAFGRRAGFLFSWSQLLIVRPGSIVAMAFPFASYFYAVCPIGEGMFSPHQAKLAMVITAIVGLTIINAIGIKASIRTQNLLTLVKILGIGSILLLPLFHTGQSPPPPSELGNANYGLALILVLFAYGGWSEVTLIAGEVREPNRNLSRSIFLAVGTVGILYLALNGVFLTLLGMEGLGASEAAATDAVRTVAPGYAGYLVSLLICISALGAVHGMILTGARVTYIMGEDHKGFKLLSGWSEESGTPVRALVVQCIICILVTLLAGNFENAVIYTTSITWIFYLLCGVAVMVLRQKGKSRDRPYKLPFYPVVPIIFCVSCAYLIYSSIDYDPAGSLIAMGLSLLGLVFYKPQPRQ